MHMNQSRVHDAKELLDIWQSLEHNAVDSATDEWREVIVPVYGPEDSLSNYCDNNAN